MNGEWGTGNGEWRRANAEVPVGIPRDGNMLVGDLHRGSDHAVILLPGWSGTRYGPQRILWETAQAAAARGFSTLRFDFAGRGDSAGDEAAASLDSMIADAEAAIEWLREAHAVRCVSLVGLCSGGNVGLGVASQTADVAHVVCWSLLPFMEHKAKAAGQGTARGQLLRHYMRRALSVDTWRRLLRGEASVTRAAKVLAGDKEGAAEERLRKTSARDILRDLQTWDGHLHLLYGTSDPEASGSREFFTAWAAKHGIPTDIAEVQGAPHNFYTAAWTAQVVATTMEWLTDKRSEQGTGNREQGVAE